MPYSPSAPAAVAAKPADDITQVTTTLPTLNPGQTAWVSTLWRGASEDATAFELTVVQPIPKGISVSYPENTGGFSSLYKESTLLADDTDYSSIKVEVGDTVHGNQQIKLNVEYQLAGKKQKQKVDVTLPVVEASGPTVEQLTSTAGPIQAGAAEWVDVTYKANKPGVTDARLTVTPPAGATVSYPNDGNFKRASPPTRRSRSVKPTTRASRSTPARSRRAATKSNSTWPTATASTSPGPSP